MIMNVFIASRGVRNNNLGNLRYNGKNLWKGLVGKDDRGFCRFSDISYGVRALGITLRTYYSRRGLTRLSDIISRYAPSSENHTEEYYRYCIMYIKRHDPFFTGCITKVSHFRHLIGAIIHYENGGVQVRHVLDTYLDGAFKSLDDLVIYCLVSHDFDVRFLTNENN